MADCERLSNCWNDQFPSRTDRFLNPFGVSADHTTPRQSEDIKESAPMKESDCEKQKQQALEQLDEANKKLDKVLKCAREKLAQLENVKEELQKCEAKNQQLSDDGKQQLQTAVSSVQCALKKLAQQQSQLQACEEEKQLAIQSQNEKLNVLQAEIENAAKIAREKDRALHKCAEQKCQVEELAKTAIECAKDNFQELQLERKRSKCVEEEHQKCKADKSKAESALELASSCCRQQQKILEDEKKKTQQEEQEKCEKEKKDILKTAADLKEQMEKERVEASNQKHVLEELRTKASNEIYHLTQQLEQTVECSKQKDKALQSERRERELAERAKAEIAELAKLCEADKKKAEENYCKRIEEAKLLLLKTHKSAEEKSKELQTAKENLTDCNACKKQLSDKHDEAVKLVKNLNSKLKEVQATTGYGDRTDQLQLLENERHRVGELETRLKELCRKTRLIKEEKIEAERALKEANAEKAVAFQKLRFCERDKRNAEVYMQDKFHKSCTDDDGCDFSEGSKNKESCDFSKALEEFEAYSKQFDCEHNNLESAEEKKNEFSYEYQPYEVQQSGSFETQATTNSSTKCFTIETEKQQETHRQEETGSGAGDFIPNSFLEHKDVELNGEILQTMLLLELERIKKLNTKVFDVENQPEDKETPSLQLSWSGVQSLLPALAKSSTGKKTFFLIFFSLAFSLRAYGL